MAQILSVAHTNPSKLPTISSRLTKSDIHSVDLTRRPSQKFNRSWNSIQRDVQSDGKFSCMFSDNRSKDQARKALESALGGKKTEFEKWDKEIKKREEAGGGGDGGGGGGWFGWRRWFGGSDGDHFWHEAQQISLTILAIAITFLLIAKGDVLLAVVFNPLLFALRGPRNGLRYVTSRFRNKVTPFSAPKSDRVPKDELYASKSAKESVMRKWGRD